MQTNTKKKNKIMQKRIVLRPCVQVLRVKICEHWIRK